jgi:hypothetical protein
MRGDRWMKLANDRERKPDKNSDAVFGTSFRVFSQKQAKSIYILFSSTGQP